MATSAPVVVRAWDCAPQPACRNKERSKQQRIVLIGQVHFVSRLVSKQADHQIRCVASFRIKKSSSLRQPLVRSAPCADESWHQQRRPRRVGQAESRRLDKAAGIIERAHGIPIHAPLLATKLIEFWGSEHSVRYSALCSQHLAVST
jgi:hypothetical protein